MELDFMWKIFLGTTNADQLSPTFTLFQRLPAPKDTMLKNAAQIVKLNTFLRLKTLK